jgi:single-strand DNA-binding protein|tara:strand:- start:1320 stop:1775 length:456 start_codon:yes stop_codon:yes gene_type:complete
MGFNNTVTVVGNVTKDPELRFTPGGAPVANFGLAWNRKDQNGEEVVSFFDITCWRSLAENVAESITKGQRVIVYGRLDQRSWENQEGERRSKVEIVADEVAPSLLWATAEITRTEFRGGGDGGDGGGAPSGSGGGRPASGAGNFPTDEEPF